VSLKIFDSFDGAEAFHFAWDELTLRTKADIYQTFDWCRIWWQHYGRNRSLHLLLGFSGDRLLGVMPIFTETLWLGPSWLRVAKLVGSDFSLQFCNLAVEDAYLPSFVEAATDRFVGELACDLLLLGPLCGPAAKIDEILVAVRGAHAIVQEAQSIGTGCATRFELPVDFDSYLKDIGSRQRGNYTRAMKQWANLCQIKSDVISSADEVCKEFSEFAVLHESQWVQEGKLGHFGDWPKGLAFNRDLVECLSKQSKVRFYRILADGKVACSQYCFIHGNTNYWRLPARATDPGWEKLSLGKLGLVKMFEDSITEGITAVEGGRGHYDYKIQLGATEWPLRTVQIMRRGTSVRLRVRLFRALANLLNLVYYRVFYIRVAPRFPWIRTALWPVWIRSTW
jgi:CelD/BcsL family acetyltransferase involved in cellulose biosynthesis